MNIAILFGIVYIFGALMMLWNVFFPDLVPELIQRVVYLLMTILCGSLAYDTLVVGVVPFQ